VTQVFQHWDESRIQAIANGTYIEINDEQTAKQYLVKII
jgi:hypothetical protein